MADNIAVTPGAGANIAADDVGGILYQRVKLAVGVDGAAADASVNAGTTDAGTIRVTLPSDQSAVAMRGDVASGATDSGNPVKIGGLGKTTNPTAVTDGQRVAALMDKVGRQIVAGTLRDLKGVQQTTIAASTAETTIVTAVAATFLDLYGLVLANSSATATTITIKDATAGTTRLKAHVPAASTVVIALPVDSAIPQAAVNTAWTATSSASITSLEVTALYTRNV